jgi:hypothetical protein
MPKMPEQLTEDDLDSFFRIGELMCRDMIGAAAVADVLANAGESDDRITDGALDAWVAIATEYAEALDDLEASGTLCATG